MKNLVLTFSLIFTFSSAIFSQIPTDGLIGYWSFTGNTIDESGTGNDFSGSVAPRYGIDRFGNNNSCLSFGDPTYNLSIEGFNNPDTICLSYWINIDRLQFSNMIRYGVTCCNGYGGYISDGIGAEGDRLNIVTGSINGMVTGNSLIIELNSWAHIVMIKENNTFSIYYNGIYHSSGTSAYNTPSPDSLSIGDNSYGLIDDIRIYDRALISSEISSLYNEDKCFETIYDTITIHDTVAVSGSYISYTEQVITSPIDNQGDAVAIHENIAAIGRAWEDKQSLSNSGAAQVYEYNGTSWTQTGDLYNSAGAVEDLFGHNIATDGNSIIIGAPGEGNGAAYIYSKSGGNWMEQAQLTLDAGEIISNEIYAISSDIDGGVAVIGSGSSFAINCNSTGSAYVYEFDGNDWLKTARLTADDGQPFDNFGTDVKVYGNTIVVGAEGICMSAATQGYAYVFEKVDGTWTQTAKLTAHDGIVGDGFGRTLCLYDDKIVVGVYRHNSQTGAAYFYEKVDGNWEFREKIVPNDIATGDAFGYEVSIWENRLLAASNSNSNVYTNNGAAYIFEYNGSNWVERQKILPLEGGEDYRFGRYNDLSASSAILKVQGGATHILKFHNVETIYDTIPIYDSIPVNDTIPIYDTIPVYDSIAVTDTLIIDAVLTGIDPPNNINTLLIYPNPAKDHIYINTGDYTRMARYRLKIIDQLGATVFETDVEEPLYEVNLSTWSGEGLYFVQVIDSDGKIIDVRKIILQ